MPNIKKSIIKTILFALSSILGLFSASSRKPSYIRTQSTSAF